MPGTPHPYRSKKSKQHQAPPPPPVPVAKWACPGCKASCPVRSFFCPTCWPLVPQDRQLDILVAFEHGRIADFLDAITQATASLRQAAA